jgi:hypothetical protein
LIGYRKKEKERKKNEILAKTQTSQKKNTEPEEFI